MPRPVKKVMPCQNHPCDKLAHESMGTALGCFCCIRCAMVCHEAGRSRWRSNQQDSRHEFTERRTQTEPAHPRKKSVPAPARLQSRGLVSVGRRGVCQGAQGGQTDLTVHWVL